METLKEIIEPFNVNYIFTIIGTIAGYIFSAPQGKKYSVSFLKSIFPGRSKVFYNRLDFIIIVILGSTIGWVLFAPTTPAQALVAGFSWTTAMNFLLYDRSDNDLKNDSQNHSKGEGKNKNNK